MGDRFLGVRSGLELQRIAQETCRLLDFESEELLRAIGPMPYPNLPQSSPGNADTTYIYMTHAPISFCHPEPSHTTSHSNLALPPL
ncbi:MAG: hypothetical protein U7126_29210 [Microcoleus sp.]